MYLWILCRWMSYWNHRPGWMPELRFSTPSLWLLEALSLSPVTTLFSEWMFWFQNYKGIHCDSRPSHTTFLQNILVATTVSKMPFSSPSSTAALRFTLRRLSTPSSVSGQHRNLTNARKSEFHCSQEKILQWEKIDWDLFVSEWTHISFFVTFSSNILKLINAFDYPESSITTGNYDEVLTHLNQTNPDIIQELNLMTCDMQSLLSQASRCAITCYFDDHFLVVKTKIQ